MENSQDTHQTNATGTLNILQAGREAGVKRVVYASSSSVYGNMPSDSEETVPKREDLPPHPESPYAVSKLAGEEYCRVFYGLYGLKTVALRYFNVFGWRHVPASAYAAVVPKFMAALARGKSPIV